MAEPRGARNFFELFGLSESFDLDTAELAARYRDLARQFHPDRFAQSPPAERRLSLEMTATLNEALQTLRDPLERARYLLGLRGVDTGEDTDTHMSPGFLMTQMELRERLAGARQAPDRAPHLEAVRRHADDEIRERMQSLRAAFASSDEASLRDARNAVREMQFLRKLLQEIDAADDA